MKGMRSELVHSTIGNYLKRRQFSDSDTFKKSDLKLHQSLPEMTLQGILQSQSGLQNALIFNSVEVTANDFKDQYTKLKDFISEASEPYKSQLTYFLFPLFLELYLELVSKDCTEAAQNFYVQHHKLFLQVESYQEVLNVLPNVLLPHDIENHQEIIKFRKSKYKVIVSEECMEYLLRHLKLSKQAILFHFINLCFDIEVHNNESCELQLFGEHVPHNEKLPQKVTACNQVKASEKSSTSSDALAALKLAIKNVNDSLPCLPSVCLYTISGGSHKMITADMPSDNMLLAASFDDSSIRLWNQKSGSMVSTPSKSDVSKVHLACDALENEQKSEITDNMKILRGHGGRVFGLTFLPKCDLLLSCSEDATVRTWSMKTHTNLAIYIGHSYPIWDIDASPYGMYFATASKDHTARLFTVDRTYPQRIFVGHNSDVDCVKFHPNACYVATGSSDRTVRLWSVQTGKLVRVLHGHRGSIFALAFSPNGLFLASAGEDRKIKIWDLATNNQIKELRGHTDIIYSLSFSADSSLLASGGLEQAIRIWDVRRTATHAATSSGPTPSSVGVESHTSPELLLTLPTKTYGHRYVQFSRKNILFAVGATESPAED